MCKKYYQKVSYLLLAGMWFLGACQNDPLDINGSSTDDLEQYLQENNIPATKAPEGYYFEALQTHENGLSVQNGNIVSIYYSISSLSGSGIDEHAEEDGPPVKLLHGKDAVWPVGIDLGLEKMREGEIYRLYLPAALAYQSVASEGIPADGSVIAEIEVVEVSNVSRQEVIDEQIIESYILQENLNNVREFSSGLKMRTQNSGNGNSPGNGQEVTISYTAKFTDNTVFSNGVETVTLGNNSLMEGLEEGIRSMKFGEKALLLIPSNLGYGESVRIIPSRIAPSLVNSKIIPAYSEKVPPFRVLIFEVTLQQ